MTVFSDKPTLDDSATLASPMVSDPDQSRHLRGLMVRYPHACVGLLILLTLAGFIAGLHHFAEEAKRQTAFDKARTFLESIIGVHTYYSKNIVPRIEASGGVFDMRFSEYPDRFPFPASVSIEFGKALQSINPNLTTNIYSSYPFPIRAARVLDAFEQESLAFLKQNPGQDFARIETRDGVEFVRYARSMKMADDCVACHNNKEFNFDINWKTGEFRGARQVSMPISDITPITDSATIWAVVIAVAASAGGGLLVMPVVGRLRQSLSETEVHAGESRDLAAALNRTNTQLISAIDTKNKFLAGVSHDLRTPLNAIIGFSDLLNIRLSDQNHNQRLASYARDIRDSGLHLHSLIDHILEISALESGQWTPNDAKIDLHHLVDSLSPLLEKSLSAANMVLTVDIPATLPALMADEQSVRRLFTNLIDNAAKYSGGGKVEISTSVTPERAIEIRISDDGKGVDDREIERLRQLGIRASTLNDKHRESLGLGLWLVDMLMAAHGGEVVFAKSDGSAGLKIILRFPPNRTVT